MEKAKFVMSPRVKEEEEVSEVEDADEVKEENPFYFS